MRLFFSAVCLSFVVLAAPAGGFAAEKNRDVPNALYLSIEKHAIDWIGGLFGSTKFRETALSDLCDDSRGERIVTPYSYVLVSPYDTVGSGFVCTFTFESWLVIQGYVEPKQLLPFQAARSEGSTWWRAASLVSIAGKIRKFRLDSSPDGKRLILFLDGISFRTPDQDEAKPQ